MKLDGETKEEPPVLSTEDQEINTFLTKQTKDPDILQHLSEAHLQNPMAREDPK